MSEPIQPHDFDPVSYLCRRCGIAEVWQGYRPNCAPREAVRDSGRYPGAAPAPEAAGGPSTAPETTSQLDNAIRESPWDRMDRRFRR